MYIGKLNEKLHGVSVAARDMTSLVPLPGDVWGGAPVTFPWQDFPSGGLDLCLTLSSPVTLDSLVLRFGESSHPKRVTLFNKEKTVEIYRYEGETGHDIREKELLLPVYAETDCLTVTVESDFTDVTIEEFSLFGRLPGGLTLFPEPLNLSDSGEFLPASVLGSVSFCPEARHAARVLREKLAENEDLTVSEEASGFIRMEKDPSLPKNGYRLRVSPAGVLLQAADVRGFVIGAETLVKLAKDGRVAVCEISDAPMAEFRGVHLYLPARKDLAFTERLVKYVISPGNYNAVILEVGGGMRFDSHPEINEAYAMANRRHAAGEWPAFPHGELAGGEYLEKDEVRRLLETIRSYGLTVIPEIQSLGHVQYLTLAHPELAEIPVEEEKAAVIDQNTADIPPAKLYPHCYCPSAPGTYHIMFELIDEILDVFKPEEFVHMGHDEVYQIGVCERCRDQDPAELYAKDVTLYHDYLAARGLKMMIWGDMLQPVTQYKTPPARKLIPKDVVLLDFIWYFHLDQDIEDNLLSEGFRVVMGNLYSSHYPRYESRRKKPGIWGGQISCWTATSEYELAKEGKLYDMLLTGELLWSEKYASAARRSYDAVISRMMPVLREKLSGVTPPSREKGAVIEAFTGNQSCRSLIFRHAAEKPMRRIPWGPLDVIGHYAVHYADGSEEKIPVEYAGNISFTGRWQNDPLPHPYYRHNGYTGTYTADTEVLVGGTHPEVVYRWEWINPRPETPVTSVEYLPAVPIPVRVFGILRVE